MHCLIAEVCLYACGFPRKPFSSLHHASSLLDDRHARPLFRTLKNMKKMEPAELRRDTGDDAGRVLLYAVHLFLKSQMAILENVMGFAVVLDAMREIVRDFNNNFCLPSCTCICTDSILANSAV